MRTALDRLFAARAAGDATATRRGAIADRRTRPRAEAPAIDPVAPTDRSSLATALAAGTYVVTVEMEPPRSADTAELEQHALALRQAGATVLDISDIPMARLRMTGLAAAARVQGVTGLETVLHFPVRGRNLLRVQGDLLAAHALGIRNLFVTMGDPAVIGDYPQAFDHHDIVPTGLIRLVKEQFNRGVDHAGSSIGAPCSFVVGAAANLTPHDVDHEATLLHRKVEAGADFLLTQPVFRPDAARSFLDRYEARFGALRVPVLLGVLPLATVRHARFLDNEVPGMSLPPEVIAAMDAAGEQSREVGLELAASVALELRDRVAGVYVIPAFRRYDLVARLLSRLVTAS
jgi:homocysteine S-methyltransferase